MTRYQHLASLLAERIEQGLYRDGEKLPSVRSLSQEHGVSISTVQQAYQTLEQQRLITPQPRSGYFVAPRKAQPPVPPMSRPVQRPVEITQWDQVLTMLDARQDKSIIPFGGGSPDVTQPSLKPLWRELSRVIQHNINEVLNYDELAGRRELREQIARLMLDGGSVLTADDLIITSGCHSALSLALLSVCQPGDIVAVESPSYYGTMQLLRLVEKQIAKDDVQVFPSEEYAQGHRKQGAATGIYTPQELMKMDWLDECVEGEMPRYEALDVKSRFLLGVNGLDRYKDEPR